MIGERTKVALAAAKARGVALGGWREQSGLTPRPPMSAPATSRAWPA